MDGEEPSQEASADLDVRGVDLTMARVRTEIRGELDAIGVTVRLAGQGVYLEVDDGVASSTKSEQ
jgi:hypothetical protein